MLIRRYFTLLIFFSSLGIQAQTDVQALETFVHCVDYQYGTDDLLVNGKPHTPKNTLAKGFPYFLYQDWTAAEIYILGEQKNEAQIKYNIETNQLILKKKLKNGVSVEVIMNENLVDSFQLDDHLFVRQSLITKDQREGFLEKIYSGSFTFYQFHKKLFDPVYTASKPHGQYSEAQPVFFVVNKGEVEKISRESAFFAYFGKWKPGIKAFMDQNNITLKKASANQLSILLKFIDDEK